MLTLRLATADDLPYLTEWEAEPGTSAWLGETGPTWHERAMKDPDQEHLIAVEGEHPVGFVVLAGLRDDGPAALRSVELRRIVISSAHRGTGLGRALLRSVLERTYGYHGARSVWLDVKAQNHRARKLYESEGFVADGGVTEDDLVIMTHRSL